MQHEPRHRYAGISCPSPPACSLSPALPLPRTVVVWQAVLSGALDRRMRLLRALRMKYTGRQGRYNKPDTHVKRQLELEIGRIKQGSLPDDDWMDNENVRAYLDYAASASAAAAAAAQVRPRQHDAP